MSINYNKIAQQLDNAAFDAQATSQISLETPFNLQESYAIQSIVMSKRYLRGHKLVGLKLGFTSKAKMEQMGVHDMIWGRLTSDMQYADNDTLQKSKFIHPRAEPEIAFLVKKRIDKILTQEDLATYISSTAVAIEIIDSRYENFKFSLEDVIADNCSSAGFALGKWHPISQDVRDIDISLKVDEEVAHAGNSNAILGNPYESLFAISRLSIEYGETIEEGSIILAGAATPAVFIQPGNRIEASANGLGTVVLNVS